MAFRDHLKSVGSDSRKLTNFNDLPAAAKEYIRTIEKLANVPVVLISTGPSRDQIIVQKNLFT